MFYTDVTEVWMISDVYYLAKGLEQRSRYSDYAAGYTVRGSNPRKDFFSSPKRPGRLWGPPSLLFNGNSEVKWPGHEASHSLLYCRG
jgi:hypothetical protein